VRLRIQVWTEFFEKRAQKKGMTGVDALLASVV
jgi:hypothetical protein